MYVKYTYSSILVTKIKICLLYLFYVLICTFSDIVMTIFFSLEMMLSWLMPLLLSNYDFLVKY